ncbi:MAG: DUF3298 and DUF4163 domain-containing protein [Pseudomonadota bacterium]|nr:DUF3298 and DUF4163 domain-containing protein [Pseudomonadota bacterium]
MKHPGSSQLLALLLVTLAVSGCQEGQSPDRAQGTTRAPVSEVPVAVEQEPVDLEEVLEITPEYMVGITYPQSAIVHPRLAAEMKRYAEEQRAQFMEAVQARAESKGASDDGVLYDLSLRFTQVIDTPQLAAYAAEGSSFTGGAHANALLERFVWLPDQGRLLTFGELVPGKEGREAVAAHVREQLHTALSQRVDADELPAGERSEWISSASRMIEEGTQPDPENLDTFEPVVNSSGKVTALRFVFPPYQVGPYSDGVQTAQVPSAVLRPHVATEYQDMFAEG